LRVVIQRVRSASVSIAGEKISSIDEGLLILLGVRQGDHADDARYLAEKTANLRIFEDEPGKMNLSVMDTGGKALVVSQFTLYADTRKGRRPGFSDAAAPEIANELYELFCNALSDKGIAVVTGRFAAMMDVALINCGPVTIIIESEQRNR
jgi:D-aminoacyl-tRNA deacylase